MKFKFDVNKTDKDFINFNVFFGTKGPLGKQINVVLRVLIAVAFLTFFVLDLYDDGFSMKNLIIASILDLMPLIILQIFIQPIYGFISKLLCKILVKGKGKKPYTESLTVEIYDDYIITIEQYEKTEIQYPAFETIYVVEGKAVYLSVNKNSATIIPDHCFASPEQKTEFVEFLKTKSSNVVCY